MLNDCSQGPPNAQKTSVSSTTSGLGSAPPGETSYELLLQQQQLFLQWQLEWQHKVRTRVTKEGIRNVVIKRPLSTLVSNKRRISTGYVSLTPLSPR